MTDVFNELWGGAFDDVWLGEVPIPPVPDETYESPGRERTFESDARGRVYQSEDRPRTYTA